ncbi:Protein of unknown function [Propionibacterium freudenreichii]|nr:Protein of unknown function [Propionibacterium freudenreichii]CEH02174.1 Protein of unknown function [Propionibacterium freudenreichii]
MKTWFRCDGHQVDTDRVTAHVVGSGQCCPSSHERV